MAKRPAKPAGYPWVMPYLVVKDADKALAFYQKAFGFEKKMSMPGPDGKTMHCEIVYRDYVIMFGPENPTNPCKSPLTTGTQSPVGIYVYVDDVDAFFKRAKAAGAKVESEPKDQFYGDRNCALLDPDGYRWSFGTNVADFDPSKAPK
jgi:PhnB protein